ncbi:MAG: AmmeMemoRadiSam system protein B [Candidatus Omnitrophota bacterium]
MIRKPVVSGQFYPQTEKSLKDLLSKLIDIKDPEKEDALGLVLPHAGYIYSGGVAGKTLSKVDIKNTAVILGTNHTLTGAKFSIMTHGSWNTPLGDVKIDTEIAEAILKESSLLKEDVESHLYEHSIEVELPFLQYLKKDIKIVPITVGMSGLDELKLLGQEIARGYKKIGRSAFFIASTDFTHYEKSDLAEKKDGLAIEAILSLDEEKLYNTVRDNTISMCGAAPTCTLIAICKNIGAKKAGLVKYQTSGDVSGDYSSVVGYAGLILW